MNRTNRRCLGWSWILITTALWCCWLQSGFLLFAAPPGGNRGQVSVHLTRQTNNGGSTPDWQQVKRWYPVLPKDAPQELFFGDFWLVGSASQSAGKAPGNTHPDPTRLARIRAARMLTCKSPVMFNWAGADAIVSALEFFPPDHVLNQYVYPATHFGSRHENKEFPRMGGRFRLRADSDTAGFSPEVQTILTALKRYGMIVADNGIEWAVSVTPDPRIPVLHAELRKVKGSDFEVIVAL